MNRETLAKANYGLLKTAWLKRLQKEYLDIIWRHSLKITPATLSLTGSGKVWGQWQAESRRIVISEELISSHPWRAVKGILGHEVAHQMAGELAGGRAAGEKPHGLTFQQMGKRLGLDPFYLKATVELKEECPKPWPDSDLPPAEEKKIRLLEKVQKLMALSGSPVAAEAQAAMDAAARLMARHNLEELAEHGGSKGVYETRVVELNSPRLSATLALAAHILNRHFFVETIFVPSYNPSIDVEEKSLEIMGRPENVRLAEHVFRFLLERSESLWQQYRSKHKGGGLRARNSFLNGLMEEFCRKLDDAANSSEDGSAEGFSALVLAGDRGLKDYIKLRHPRVSTARTGRRAHCPASEQAGRAAGRALNLNSPVEFDRRGGQGFSGFLPVRGSNEK